MSMQTPPGVSPTDIAAMTTTPRQTTPPLPPQTMTKKLKTRRPNKGRLVKRAGR